MRLEERPGAPGVGPGLGQHLDRVRVEPYGDRAEQLLVRRFDQIGPGDRHSAPRLAPEPVGADCRQPRPSTPSAGSASSATRRYPAPSPAHGRPGRALRSREGQCTGST